MKFFLSESTDWSHPYAQEVIKQFKQYKSTASASELIGRDAPLMRPSSAVFASMWHMHLPSPGEAFNLHQLVYHRTSDNFLIYCAGFTNPTHYLLIDILAPDAHDKSENIDLMNRYIKQADKFRESH